jgi:ABC-2 type transport system ATP-binding protein
LRIHSEEIAVELSVGSYAAPRRIMTMNANQQADAAPLEVRGVTKLFGDFRVVDDVSFSLPAGSIYGFLGPNGAGKTTTLRMILEIIKPTSGSISVLGHASALAVRQRIGYLPEEKGLYKKMKCWAVIAYFATLKGLSRKAAKLRAFELLERYGLKDFAAKPTEALSKGMGQKVQMLASIAHDPEFVILDEPFSGLDPVNQQVMEEIIRDMARRNRTVLFSTHVMQHAERLCDRILLLAKGRKIFDGTVAEAKRIIPRRVRIETEDDIGPLRELGEVIFVRPLEPVNGGRPPNSAAHWELEVRENADPQAILQACFSRRIRLRSFNQSDPTLHEVFVRLVGPDAKEAAFR